MVLSMRYIPFEFLEQIHEVCASLPLSHGAPIWVGNPAVIESVIYSYQTSRPIRLPLMEMSLYSGAAA